MSVVGLGCVKTCAREEAAELFSLLSSPDGVHQRVYFSIDKIETNFLSANSISEFSHSVGHSRLARTGGGFGYVRSAPDSDGTAPLLPAMRLRIRALPRHCKKALPVKGGGAPKGANCTGRTSGCGARHAGECCHSLALRARAPSGAPPRFSPRRTHPDIGSASVPRFLRPGCIGRYPLPPVSSQPRSAETGRSAGRSVTRSRPGAGLRAPPAGTALAFVIRPSPVTPFVRASLSLSNYNRDNCQGSVANKATRPNTRENR
jgi:hypothetical protein